MIVEPTTQGLTGHYNIWLVTLSVVIAVVASYAALDLASRVTAAQGRGRVAWVAGGAFAMGMGIWAMHYVGTVAFELPVRVRYDVTTVIGSLLAAILASAVALWLMSRREMGLLRALAASTAMGAGIAIMHYTGMAAMRVPARAIWNPSLVTLSVMIAVLVSLAALWSSYSMRGPSASGWRRRKLGTSVLMGGAIALVHYTGMAASHFDYQVAPRPGSPGVDISLLGSMEVAILAFTILGIAIATCLLDRRDSASQAALRAAEAQHHHFLRQVIDTNPNLVFVKDWDGNYVLVNEALAQIYGTTVQNLIGKRDSDFNPNRSEVESYLRTDREVMSSDRTIIREESATDARTGEVRWFQSVKVPLLASPGEGKRVLGVATDITQRRQMEEELRHTSHTLETLIDAAPLAIYALDSVGRVRSWNRAAERIFGWTASEVLGETLPDVPAEEYDKWRASLDRVLGGEALPSIQLRRTHRDGRTLDLHISAAPTRGLDGSVDGVMAMADDVTERKSLGDQLRQAQKMEAVGQLSGGIAHDFNNLLTIIITSAGLIADQVAPGQTEVLTQLCDLEKAAHKGADLVRKLLAFSRQRPVELRPVDLSAIVRDAQASLRHLLPESVQLSLEVTSATPPTIIGDDGTIEQILYNLATNAGDAMPQGGSLSLNLYRTRLDEEHRRVHGWGTPGEYIVIAAADTGCGMSKETRARIFDPFFTTKEVGKGTGLGMPMVYGLMKQHNGFVDVQSEVGRGTTIRLFFPAVDVPAVKAKPEVRLAAPVGGTERILIVDDEDGVRRSAVRVLSRYGYAVEEASDCESALALLKGNTPFDLVLSDVVMPRRGGLNLYRELRNRGDRVLLMTGYTSDDLYGMDDFDPGLQLIYKPWSVNDLLLAVRTALKEPAAAA